MKKLLLGILSLSALWLTGCASIVDGNSQSVSFASNPEGATVYLNGAAIGKTPVSVTAKRKGGSQPVRFTKEGHQDIEIQLISTINPWFFGNIVTGGLLGSSTDGLSGAAFKYEPGNYMVTLPPMANTAQGEMGFLTEKQKVVNFIVAGYNGIVKELSTQSGQYLSSLLMLTNVEEAQRPDVTRRLKALSDAYPNIPEFAEKAADLLLAKP